MMQAFKSITINEYTIGVKQHGWQQFSGRLGLGHRNYYEHIIRNEDEPEKIREYILRSPFGMMMGDHKDGAMIMIQFKYV